MMRLKRRNSLVLLATGLAMVLLLSACGGGPSAVPSPTGPGVSPAKPTSEPAPPAKAPITVKIADHFPVGHLVPTTLTKPWMSRVEELTKGQVKFTHFPAEQLVKQVDALTGIQKKVVDIGLVNPGLFPTEFPLNGVVFLPSGWDTVAHGGRTIKRLLEFAPIAAEFRKSGVRPLVVQPFDAFEIMATRPVSTPDDVKGLKLRAAGEGQVLATRALGATPVVVGAPEVYTAIQRKTLDGALFPFSAAKSYKLDDVVQYSTSGANITYAVVMYSVNEEFWNGLDPSIQKAMLQAADEVMPKAWAAMDESTHAVRQAFQAAAVKLTEVSGASKTAWEERLRPVRTQWVQGMEAKGLPGAQVLAAWDKALAETR